MSEYYNFSISNLERKNLEVYNFQTDSDSDYTVIFDGEFFDFLIEEGNILRGNIFSIAIGLTDVEIPPPETVDGKISYTLLLIINDFYQRRGVSIVLVFVCDSYDHRQLSRMRKFKIWELKLRDYLGDYVLTTVEFSQDGETFPVGWVIHKENSDFATIEKELEGRVERAFPVLKGS